MGELLESLYMIHSVGIASPCSVWNYFGGVVKSVKEFLHSWEARDNVNCVQGD